MPKWVDITLTNHPQTRLWSADAVFSVASSEQYTNIYMTFNYESRWCFLAYAKAALLGPRAAAAYEAKHRKLRLEKGWAL